MLKAALLLALILLLPGCMQNSNVSADNGSSSKLKIVATIFPPYDFARAIAGDKADVTMLINPGSSVHSFDPSPADIKKINSADVFIYVGGESEAWVDRILDSIDITGKKIVRLIDCIDSTLDEVDGLDVNNSNGEESSGYDEHVWTSLSNAMKFTEAISEVICASDAANFEYYQQNTNSYIDEIKNTDTEIREVVRIAKRNKIVVADRFPFRYFVEEYGLDYCAALGSCSDQSEISAKTMGILIDTVKNEQLPYIYYAELGNQAIASSVSEYSGAGMLLLHSCHNVSKSEFDDGATYVSLMRSNAENLRKGLN